MAFKILSGFLGNFDDMLDYIQEWLNEKKYEFKFLLSWLAMGPIINDVTQKTESFRTALQGCIHFLYGWENLVGFRIFFLKDPRKLVWPPIPPWICPSPCFVTKLSYNIFTFVLKCHTISTQNVNVIYERPLLFKILRNNKIIF